MIRTPHTTIKKIWRQLGDELSEEQLREALDFALFLRSRQTTGDETIREQDQPYPLRGTVLKYAAPFEPVADSDWETLQ